MLKFLAIILVTAFAVLSAVYLSDPDLWNSRVVASVAATTESLARQQDRSLGQQVGSPVQQESIPVQNTEIAMVLAEANQPVLSDPTGEDARSFAEGSAGYSCVRTPVREVTAAREPTMYRWTDEQGRVNFSDRPPTSGVFELFETGLPQRLEYFQLNTRFIGLNTIPFFDGQLTAQVNAIYEILSGWIGADRLKQVDLNIVIFPDRPSFQVYASSVAGHLQNSGGFYSSVRNEAVTYQYPDVDMTMAVARHESVHVIVRGLLGNAPNWLNEGLAEYFESLSISNQVRQVGVNQRSTELANRVVNGGYLSSLESYLNMPDELWRTSSSEGVYYALASSLIHFLLSSEQGLYALSYLMQQQADHYCDQIDSASLLTESYPGGVGRLERDFAAWLGSRDQIRSHLY